MLQHREKIFAALILIALLVAYYNSVVIHGNSFMNTIERTYYSGHYHYSGTYWYVDYKLSTNDPAAANLSHLPNTYLENHYLKTFQLPLWNPYSGLGRPYHASMNSYTFFLPIYPFKLFPSLVMYDLFLLFRLFISGFFLFLLLRLYKCRFWIAIAGASFFMFNTHFHFFIDMDHPSITMFLSPMAYFLTKFTFSMNKRYLIGFILCSAGSLYGGNPNEFILIHLFVTAYFIFLLSIKNNLEFEKKLNFLASYVTALGLSFLLSSIKLIPFIEFWKNSFSTRAGLTGTAEVLPLKDFLSWILTPHLVLEVPNYFGYLIISLVSFSFFSLFRKRWGIREKIVAFHLILLFLVISKINGAQYINWIGTLPALNNINFKKYCSLLYYTISVISTFSLTYMVEDVKKAINKIKRLFVLLLCFALPHLLFLSISKKPVFELANNGNKLLSAFILFILTSFLLVIVKKTYKNKAITSIAVIILMLSALFEFRLNNHQYYGKRFKKNDKAPYTQFLLEQKQPYRAMGINQTFAPNHNLVYPIASINRMFPTWTKRPVILLRYLVNRNFFSGLPRYYDDFEILNNPHLDLLNTKYFISESIIDSIVINPPYAKSKKIKALLNNPSMQYTRFGDLYYYMHWGWQQLSDSSVDIPIHLPYGDVYLKSTALAFNFDWNKRNDPDNKLNLIISVNLGNKKEIILKRTFIAHREKDQDFFPLKADLSQYAGQNVIINLTLRNSGAQNINDRTFFFGDLRITYNKIKKSLSPSLNSGKLSSQPDFETVPFEDVFSHNAIVYKNNKAMARGFVLYNVKRVKGAYEAVANMKKKPLLYKNTALIEGDLPNNIKLGKPGQSKISFLDYKANFIKIDVETTENGIFILSDAYYPGWKAYLNKKQVKIFPAFCALRAVFLPKGRHELVFRYRPKSFFIGAILTFLTAIFLGYAFFKIKNYDSLH